MRLRFPFEKGKKKYPGADLRSKINKIVLLHELSNLNLNANDFI